MKRKQTKNTNSQIEKMFTIAGICLIVIGCIANIYGAIMNARFIHDPLDLAYYCRFIILLGGGFLIGYMLTQASSNAKQYSGVIYALLGYALFSLIDMLRGISQTVVESPAYPWGKIIFIGMPLFAILATLLIAYFCQYKQNRADVGKLVKTLLLVAFIGSQVYMLANSVYSISSGAAIYDPNASFWQIVGSYLALPIVVTGLSYLLLAVVKPRFDRLFYAVLIGSIYSILMYALWEFVTNASIDAVSLFTATITPTLLMVAGILLWLVRKAVK